MPFYRTRYPRRNSHSRFEYAKVLLCACLATCHAFLSGVARQPTSRPCPLGGAREPWRTVDCIARGERVSHVDHCVLWGRRRVHFHSEQKDADMDWQIRGQNACALALDNLRQLRTRRCCVRAQWFWGMAWDMPSNIESGTSCSTNTCPSCLTHIDALTHTLVHGSRETFGQRMQISQHPCWAPHQRLIWIADPTGTAISFPSICWPLTPSLRFIERGAGVDRGARHTYGSCPGL